MLSDERHLCFPFFLGNPSCLAWFTTALHREVAASSPNARDAKPPQHLHGSAALEPPGRDNVVDIMCWSPCCCALSDRFFSSCSHLHFDSSHTTPPPPAFVTFCVWFRRCLLCQHVAGLLLEVSLAETWYWSISKDTLSEFRPTCGCQFRGSCVLNVHCPSSETHFFRPAVCTADSSIEVS